jgi:sugar lactone lactonase YvrE
LTQYWDFEQPLLRLCRGTVYSALPPDPALILDFHSPSEYSNGNTFDFEGRQISCQHGTRRAARYQNDGTVTAIAYKWQGKPLRRLSGQGGN